MWEDGFMVEIALIGTGLLWEGKFGWGFQTLIGPFCIGEDPKTSLFIVNRGFGMGLGWMAHEKMNCSYGNWGINNFDLKKMVRDELSGMKFINWLWNYKFCLCECLFLLWLKFWLSMYWHASAKVFSILRALLTRQEWSLTR